MKECRLQPKIKLCGIMRIEDLEALKNGSIPDYIGFVFAPSKRQVTREKAILISKMIKSKYTHIQLVGVFVNEKIEHIEQIVNEVNLDIVQLHGDEENSYIEEFKRQVPNVKIWKAIRVKEQVDYQKIKEINCDQILLDAYQRGVYGGTGRSIPLDVLIEYEKHMGRSYILAGGIRIEQIASIAENLAPYGLDISSGIESNGYKDSDKIKKIVKLIRGENRWV